MTAPPNPFEQAAEICEMKARRLERLGFTSTAATLRGYATNIRAYGVIVKFITAPETIEEAHSPEDSP